MSEYIERGKLREFLYCLAAEVDPVKHMYTDDFVRGYQAGLKLAAECRIDDIPAADDRPERHGEWKKYKGKRERSFSFICSECNSFLPFTSKFCPRCGAKMDGEDGEQE